MAISDTDLFAGEDKLVNKYVITSALSFAAMLAPLVPVFAFSYIVFLFSRDQAGLHPLISGSIAIVTAIYSLFLLKISRLVRYIYFGVEAIVASVAAFLYALGETEFILAVIIAAAALLVGLTLAFVASNFDQFKPTI